MQSHNRPLEGKVAVVTGATRGVGKGVALALGEAGALVYATGRTLESGSSNWPGSLQETADEIARRGGTCIPVVCDHADDGSVKRLFERVHDEQSGTIDVLVNNVFAAPARMPVNVPFWELDDDIWETLLRVGLRSHYVASRCVAPRMVARRQGLIVNTSSGGAVRYTFNVPFGVQKAGVDKMAKDMAHDLKPFNVAAVVIWPGFIKSEKFLAQPDRMPAALAQRIMADGESPEFAGRAVAALAADPRIMEKTGQLHLVAELAQEYGFTDVDGRMPATPARV
ncbi:3-oxoacyl-[acyl-carrier-protein] reductase FabG [Variovorax sp. PBS-H4]|uniref:SDR family NAD(P)-dependent oxidoreductase n=1 Tax=Variovorax sp. PBS-H4 TaxID=434008 RepID=UPI001316C98B|nr:SDR family NAD(P)-dependent oxidoreductase [Variovorax sp. PBS-H4]VTU23350.1 3-oxoacyl-[acyl-carrier-protein] reductase FabG [Variovorax sp. PBS-H4]